MIACRLCNGEAEPAFTRLVLKKYDVAYFRCRQCGSLQTEMPYWLEEAYSTGNLVDTDTGAVLRNLNSQAVIFAATKILGLPPTSSIVDIGGGVGMLTRLLRDQGFDARWSDAYASNNMARGFDDDGSDADIVCSSRSRNIWSIRSPILPPCSRDRRNSSSSEQKRTGVRIPTGGISVRGQANTSSSIRKAVCPSRQTSLDIVTNASAARIFLRERP